MLFEKRDKFFFYEGAFYSILATCSLKDAKNVEKKEDYEESEQIVVHEIVK